MSNDGLILMTPEQSVKAQEIWRAFEAQHWTMVQLIMRGKNRKEIARVLGWSLQSVDHILNLHRRYLRAEGITTDAQHEKISKRATHSGDQSAAANKASRVAARRKRHAAERAERREEIANNERIARRALESLAAEENAVAC